MECLTKLTLLKVRYSQIQMVQLEHGVQEDRTVRLDPVTHWAHPAPLEHTRTSSVPPPPPSACLVLMARHALRPASREPQSLSLIARQGSIAPPLHRERLKPTARQVTSAHRVRPQSVYARQVPTKRRLARTLVTLVQPEATAAETLGVAS